MPLIPLRIPTGFAVCYNRFHDLEPTQGVDDHLLENWDYFTEDILQIVKMELVKGTWSVPEKEKLTIDLGWYPDGKPAGSYVLVAAKVAGSSWEILKEESSRDRYEIRDTLEKWMEEMNRR